MSNEGVRHVLVEGALLLKKGVEMNVQGAGVAKRDVSNMIHGVFAMTVRFVYCVTVVILLCISGNTNINVMIILIS